MSDNRIYDDGPYSEDGEGVDPAEVTDIQVAFKVPILVEDKTRLGRFSAIRGLTTEDYFARLLAPKWAEILNYVHERLEEEAQALN